MFIPPYGGVNFPYKTNLNWIIEKIEYLLSQCKSLDDMLGALQEIVNGLQNYFKNDEFIEWVIAIVQSYITTLDNLPRSNDIDIRRVFSKVEKSSIYFNSETHYNVPQSCCYIPEHDSVIVAWGPEGDLSTTSTLAKLVEYDANTFTVKREATIALYHANGMTYDPNKKLLYICGLNQFSDNNYGFLSVDYETLSVITEHPLSFNPIGCGMDTELGLIYFSGSNNTIQVVNADDYTAVREFTVKKPESSGTVLQDMEFYNNLIFAIYWRPANIVVYDTFGNLVRIYNIPTWWEKLYYSRECESLCHIGDGRFLITSYQNFESQHFTGEGSFGILNMNKNVAMPGIYPITYYSLHSAIDIYVDSSEQNTEVNPDGTKDKPLRSVQEALSIAKSPYIYSDVNIHIVGGTKEPYPITAYEIDRKVRIVGTYTFDNVTLNYCQEVAFANTISFESSIAQTGCLTLYITKAILDHCSINKGSCKYAISMTWAELLGSYSNMKLPDAGIISSILNLSSYTKEDSNIKLLDSASTTNFPILIAKGTYTETFTTEISAKVMPYADIEITTPFGVFKKTVETQPTYQTAVHIRYPNASNLIDLFFDILFSGTSIQLTNISYLTNGTNSTNGFPSGVSITKVKIHN